MNRVVLNTSFCLIVAFLFTTKPVVDVVGFITGISINEVSHEPAKTSSAEVSSGLLNEPVSTVRLLDTTLNTTICRGNSIEFNDQVITEPGMYLDTLPDVNNQDSIITLNLVVADTFLINIDLEICEGDTIMEGPHTITTDTMIVDELTSVEGCDSTVVINVVQNQVSFSELDTAICAGDSLLYQGVFYRQDTALNLFANSNGCDSVVLLTINYLDTFNVTLNESICEGESFEMMGEEFTTDTTVVFNLTTAEGCDSTVTLELEVLEVYLEEVFDTICQGETYSFQGNDFTEDSTATFNFTSSEGCDSTIVLQLTVLDTFLTEVFDTICAGETASFRGDSFTTPTQAVYNLQSVDGCDSTVAYNLTVRDTFFTEVEETICENESIQLGTQVFSTDTVYTEVFDAVNGCDSTVRYTLNVLDTIVSNVNVIACAGDTVMLGDDMFSSDTVHTVTFQRANSCDSVVIFNLNVLDSIIVDMDMAICMGSVLDFGSQMIDSAGTYTETFTSLNGCDSVVNLTVSLLDTFRTELVETFCEGDSLVIGSQVFTSDTVLIDSLQTVAGCDSIVITTIDKIIPAVVTLEEAICAGDSLQFDGVFYAQDTTVTAMTTDINGCDSTTILELNVLDTVTNRIDTTICAGEFFVVGDSAYTESARIFNEFTTSTSCITVIVDLTVADTSNITLDSTICEGDTVMLGATPLTTSGTFTETLTTMQGCDSTVTFNLEVLDSVQVTMDSTICAGDTVFFAMDTLTETGVYVDAFPLPNGCDSSIVLNLTVLQSPDIVIDTTICTGDSIMVAGLMLDSTGTYIQEFTAANGCDSTITVNLLVSDTFNVVIDTMLCQGDTLEIAELTITEGGTFTQNFQSVSGGCDSLVTVNVMQLDTFFINLDVDLCIGDSLVLADTVVTNSGIFTENLVSSGGCDSTVVYNVTLLDTVITMLDTTICGNESIIIGTDTLTESGTFEVVLEGANGCDSTVIVELNVLDSFLEENFFTICQGDTLEFRDTTFTEPGIFTETFTAANGCDSVISVIVEVAEIQNSIIDSVICQGDTVRLGRRSLTRSGRFTERLTSVDGCDSIVTINLTVNPSFDLDIDTTICRGDTVFLGNQAITTDGFYSRMLQTVNGCDSLIALNLTVIDTFFTSRNVTICEGDTFMLGDQLITEAGTYTQNLVSLSGCDSITEVRLTVAEAFNISLDQTICDGDSFLLGNRTLRESGMYIDTLQTVNGCDSIVEVNLNVSASINDTLDVTICDNEVFIFDGRFLDDPGTYQATFTSSTGCDSLVTVNLSTRPLISTRDTVTICDGESYEFGARQLTRAGEYSESFTSINGCDSVVFLNLSLRPKSASGFTATICESDTFNFNGQMLTEAGIYQEVFTAANGCDSIVTLNLRVNPISRTRITQTICDGENYVFGNRTISETGTYRDTFPAQNGCFIILALDLTVLPAVRDTISASICQGDSFTFGNQTVIQTGTYSQRLTSVSGCDSTIILQLEALENFDDTLNVTICEGETFNLGRQNLTNPGTYIAFLESQAGCDSIVTVELEVQQSIEEDISVTICNGNSYVFGDRVLESAGSYINTFTTVNGCDSVVNLELSFQDLESAITVDTMNGEIIVDIPNATFTWVDCNTNEVVLETASDTFQVPQPGLYRVFVEAEGCIDSTECFLIPMDPLSTTQLDISSSFELYPNPARDNLTLQVGDPDLLDRYELSIIDVRGKIYRNEQMNLLSRQEIPINDLPAGMYLINLFNPDKGITRMKFLKID